MITNFTLCFNNVYVLLFLKIISLITLHKPVRQRSG